MLGKAFAISVLFSLARRAAREAKIEDLRLQTAVAAREGRQEQERAARNENLQQMRDTSDAQIRMSLAGAGVDPLLTSGPAGVQAAHIQQAAANISGGRRGY